MGPPVLTLVGGRRGRRGFCRRGCGFRRLVCEAFDDVGGGFGHEGFVAELSFGGEETFLVVWRFLW